MSRYADWNHFCIVMAMADFPMPVGAWTTMLSKSSLSNAHLMTESDSAWYGRGDGIGKSGWMSVHRSGRLAFDGIVIFTTGIDREGMPHRLQ